MTRWFLQRSLLLLPLTFLCGRTRAQADLPAILTPQILQQRCTGEVNPCLIDLAEPHTLSLAGDWHLPRSIRLGFGVGSSLHVMGGTLLFDGGSIEAPAGATIFPDPDRIRGLAATRPEWFANAQAGEPVPAAALLHAYLAAEPWGSVYLQPRQYVSPFSHCPADAPFASFDSPRTLIGSGRPVPDDAQGPTRLQGGTILLGGIFGTAPLRLAHLGIDVGPTLPTRGLGDCKQAGVFIQQPGRDFVSGDRLEDISVLTTGVHDMHSVMIAGHQDTAIHDLWIWTLGGTHGLVMKSSHSTIDGYHCFGASDDCLIIKSDYVTDFLGRANDVRVSHVEIGPLRNRQPLGGIQIESTWDAVRSVEISDIQETGTAVGIVILGSHLHHAHNIEVHNWTATGQTIACLSANRVDGLRISDFQCGVEKNAVGLLLSMAHHVTLDRGVVRCVDAHAACSAGPGDAFITIDTTPVLAQVQVEDMGGFVLRTNGPQVPLVGVSAAGMDGRTVASIPFTKFQRLSGFIAQIRPDGRIFYDMIYFRPALRWGLALAVIVLVGGSSLLRIRRRIRFARRSRG